MGSGPSSGWIRTHSLRLDSLREDLNSRQAANQLQGRDMSLRQRVGRRPGTLLDAIADSRILDFGVGSIAAKVLNRAVRLLHLLPVEATGGWIAFG